MTLVSDANITRDPLDLGLVGLAPQEHDPGGAQHRRPEERAGSQGSPQQQEQARRQRAQPHGLGVVPAREPGDREADPSHPIAELQRTIGNQAVQRLLMRRLNQPERRAAVILVHSLERS